MRAPTGARPADRGIDGLWRGGLFARQTGDPYYEVKDGVGAFVGGLLRLHPNLQEPALADWRLNTEGMNVWTYEKVNAGQFYAATKPTDFA